MIFNTNQNEVKKAGGKSVHIPSALNAPALVNVYGESTQDGTPTPDTPVSIDSSVVSEIKVQGKNLFKCTSFSNGTQNGVTLEGYLNKQGFLEYFTLNGTCTNAIYRSLALPNMTLPKGSYVLSGCPSGGSNKTYRWYISTTDGKSYIDEGNGVSFTFEDTTTFTLTLVIYNGAVCNNVKFYPMISVEGGEYEPYNETVYTLPEPITLNGLNGVSDYIDFKRGVLVQKIGVSVYNGSEGWNFTTNNVLPYFHCPPFTNYAYKNDNTINYMCDYFSAITVNQRYKENTLFINNASRPTFTTSLFTTLDEWKAHLSANPMTVIYELAEPVETPLSSLPSITTFDGVNNISNDANALMSVLYATTEGAGITLENNRGLSQCLQIVSFDSSTGTLVTKSADYVG